MALLCVAYGRVRGPKSPASLPKISYAYPTIMKLGTITPHTKEYLKKYLNTYTRHPLSSADITIFQLKLTTFLISAN